MLLHPFYFLCLYRIFVQKSSFGGVVCYLILLRVRHEHSMEERVKRKKKKHLLICICDFVNWMSSFQWDVLILHLWFLAFCMYEQLGGFLDWEAYVIHGNFLGFSFTWSVGRSFYDFTYLGMRAWLDPDCPESIMSRIEAMKISSSCLLRGDPTEYSIV